MAEKLDVALVPPPIRGLLQQLQAGGGRAWLVGGTVRDLLLGMQPRDFDVATDLGPEAVARCLPGADLTHARLGTARIEGLPWPTVVTTLRAEASYTDHRRPEQVRFVAEPALDAPRRDFTINALYADAVGTVVDPVGGLADLRARRLAAIGRPEARFAEDPLRLLRALRFASRFALDWDHATAAAARGGAPLLHHLSAERCFAELTGTFTGPHRGSALRQFVELGFAAALLPEVAAMDGVPQPPQYHPEGDVLTHVCLVLDQVPADDAVLAWAAVLHDIGKPPTFRQGPDRIRFDGHDTLSATMADAVLARLRAPKGLRSAVVEICRDHIRMASLLSMRPRRREQWLRSPLFPQHLAFHRADCLGSHGNLEIHAAAAAALAALPPARRALLTGADVLALGVPEGPLVGELLRGVEAELDLQGTADPSRDEALAVLRRLAGKGVKP